MEELARFPDDEHTRAYVTFAQLPGGSAKWFEERPPVIKKASENKDARFFYDNDKLVVDRVSFLLAIFSFSISAI